MRFKSCFISVSILQSVCVTRHLSNAPWRTSIVRKVGLRPCQTILTLLCTWIAVGILRHAVGITRHVIDCSSIVFCQHFWLMLPVLFGVQAFDNRGILSECCLGAIYSRVLNIGSEHSGKVTWWIFLTLSEGLTRRNVLCSTIQLQQILWLFKDAMLTTGFLRR